jgi:amino acid adenylation domain-containing protein
VSAVTDLLAKLAERGVRLSPDGERLRVRGPRDALDASDTQALRLHKAEILSLLRTQASTTAGPIMPPLSRPARLPLAFAQERLWFLAQLEQGVSAYNLTLLLHLQGPLDATALGDALAIVVSRHELLRTRFPATDGIPEQCIDAKIEIPLEQLDFGDLPRGERLEAARTVLAERAAEPYDLSCGPLLRAALARLDDADHVLLLGTHHILADGWSLGLLIGELDTIYRARIDGRELDLPRTPLQYADFALWQRRRAEGADWQCQLEWWREQLAGVPTLIGLPTDRPRPSVQDASVASLPLRLDLETSEHLEQLGRQHGATLFQVMLALWVLLLRRYSDEDDMVIGTPVANRHYPGLEQLVGCLVNTLPLRADLGADPSFVTLLGRLRHTTLEAYAHQDIPVEQIVNVIAAERSLSHAPLFQVMLTVEYADSHPAARDYALGEARGAWLDTARDSTELDLALELVRTRDGLAGWLDYSPALFDRATIERMVEQLRMLAEAVPSDPDRAISTMPLLTKAECRLLLEDWNPSDPFRDADDAIQTILEQQAARTPDTTALIIARPGIDPVHSERLTYAEFNARANRFAHWLLGLQLPQIKTQIQTQIQTSPEADGNPHRRPLIGVCMGRSADLVTAILGILKAGFGYVPVDPTWPQARIAAILTDARPLAILAEPGLLGSDLNDDPMRIDPARAWSETRAGVDTDLPCRSRYDDIAYVMYTSGSTGTPKGVVIEHRNVASYIRAFVPWARLTPADRVLQHGSIAFDLCIEEIFPALSIGASVVLCTDPVGLDAIVAEAIRHRATLIGATPLLVHYCNSRAEDLPDLRFIASGGDVLRAEDVDRLLARGIEVTNSFGPTETTVTATSHRVRPGEDPLPIGRPLANSRALVLDVRRNLVPIGVPGELCIGGAGVGRGYLNRPQLTAEHFIDWRAPEQSREQQSERLYRTGDRARWRADGRLEFIGRMDRQVKVRGFRVELGEIEAAIATHPGVEQAVALTRPDEQGQKRLVAYIVPSSDSVDKSAEKTVAVGVANAAAFASTALPSALPEQLRDHLRAHLPGWMIPGAFVLLDRLPLTPTGKIDRKALPEPTETVASASTRHPRSITEQDAADHLARGTGEPGGWHFRRFLRAWRPLPAGHPAGDPHRRCLCHRVASAGPVPLSDGRSTGRLPGADPSQAYLVDPGRSAAAWRARTLVLRSRRRRQCVLFSSAGAGAGQGSTLLRTGIPGYGWQAAPACDSRGRGCPPHRANPCPLAARSDPLGRAFLRRSGRL